MKICEISTDEWHKFKKSAVSNHFPFKNTELIIVSVELKTKQNANTISSLFVSLPHSFFTTLDYLPHIRWFTTLGNSPHSCSIWNSLHNIQGNILHSFISSFGNSPHLPIEFCQLFLATQKVRLMDNFYSVLFIITMKGQVHTQTSNSRSSFPASSNWRHQAMSHKIWLILCNKIIIIHKNYFSS